MENATRDEVDALCQTEGWHKAGHVVITTKVGMILSDEELAELARLVQVNIRMLLKLAVKGL